MSPDYHQNYPHGIMFHRFYGPSLPKCQGALSATELESLILNIGVDRIIDPKQWLDRLENNMLKNDHICLTFDDCLKSQIQIAEPVLKKYNLTAFFFVHSLTFFNEVDYNEVFSNIISLKYDNFQKFLIEFLSFLQLDDRIFSEEKYIKFKISMENSYSFYSDSDIKYRYLRNKYFDNEEFINLMRNFFSEKDFLNDINYDAIWMNESDLLNLIKSGNMIGLHSYSHRINFQNLSYADQLVDYKKNILHLENLCGYKIKCASHPLGSYNSDTIKILKDLGIECAFRSNNVIPPSSKKINPNKLELARVDVCDIIRQQ